MIQPPNFRHYDDWHCYECSKYLQYTKKCAQYVNWDCGEFDVCDSFVQRKDEEDNYDYDDWE